MSYQRIFVSVLGILIPNVYALPVYNVNGIISSVSSPELNNIVVLSVTAAFFICFALIALGCVCCRNHGLKVLHNENGLVLPRHGGTNQSQGESMSEFTIFPPPSTVLAQPKIFSHEDEVTFEPLPEIRPRNVSIPAPSVHPPRPAHFGSAVTKGLSLHDWFDDTTLNFPRNQLQYLKEMGSGWFGQVVEGEAQNIVPGQRKTQVVVKILREDASPSEHIHFLHEVRLFRDLQHPNILHLLGRCLENDPFLIILEYFSADLKTFLIQHRSKSESLLQEGQLLQMACNIASALQYMHERGFIHTDLAARNCLVSSDMTVKIGDYGTSIQAFKEDYYCLGDIALPVRWCAPESLHCTNTTIETKEVTREANIWSLGVLLWELLEFGKLPYIELGDDEVLQKVVVERSLKLEQPKTPCVHKDMLYQIMHLCWGVASERPLVQKVAALLNHLYENRDVPSDSAAFESRWHSLQPARTEHNLTSSTGSESSGVQLRFESDFAPKLCVRKDRDSMQSSSENDQSFTGEVSPSRGSLCTNFEVNLATQISPSLQNLRGSIEDLAEEDERQRQPMFGSLEFTERESSTKSPEIQPTPKQEAEISQQQISEAIENLDSILDKELTSFEEAANQSKDDLFSEMLATKTSLFSSESKKMENNKGNILFADISLSSVKSDPNVQDFAKDVNSSENGISLWSNDNSSSQEPLSGEFAMDKPRNIADFFKLTVVESEVSSDSDMSQPHSLQGTFGNAKSEQRLNTSENMPNIQSAVTDDAKETASSLSISGQNVTDTPLGPVLSSSVAHVEKDDKTVNVNRAEQSNTKKTLSDSHMPKDDSSLSRSVSELTDTSFSSRTGEHTDMIGDGIFANVAEEGAQPCTNVDASLHGSPDVLSSVSLPSASSNPGMCVNTSAGIVDSVLAYGDGSGCNTPTNSSTVPVCSPECAVSDVKTNPLLAIPEIIIDDSLCGSPEFVSSQEEVPNQINTMDSEPANSVSKRSEDDQAPLIRSENQTPIFENKNIICSNVLNNHERGESTKSNENEHFTSTPCDKSKCLDAFDNIFGDNSLDIKMSNDSTPPHNNLLSSKDSPLFSSLNDKSFGVQNGISTSNNLRLPDGFGSRYVRTYSTANDVTSSTTDDFESLPSLEYTMTGTSLEVGIERKDLLTSPPVVSSPEFENVIGFLSNPVSSTCSEENSLTPIKEVYSASDEMSSFTPTKDAASISSLDQLSFVEENYAKNNSKSDNDFHTEVTESKQGSSAANKLSSDAENATVKSDLGDTHSSVFGLTSLCWDSLDLKGTFPSTNEMSKPGKDHSPVDFLNGDLHKPDENGRLTLENQRYQLEDMYRPVHNFCEETKHGNSNFSNADYVKSIKHNKNSEENSYSEESILLTDEFEPEGREHVLIDYQGTMNGMCPRFYLSPISENDDSSKYSLAAEDKRSSLIFEDLETGETELVLSSTQPDEMDEEVLIVDTETNEAILVDSNHTQHYMHEYLPESHRRKNNNQQFSKLSYDAGEPSLTREIVITELENKSPPVESTSDTAFQSPASAISTSSLPNMELIIDDESLADDEGEIDESTDREICKIQTAPLAKTQSYDCILSELSQSPVLSPNLYFEIENTDSPELSPIKSSSCVQSPEKQSPKTEINEIRCRFDDQLDQLVLESEEILAGSGFLNFDPSEILTTQELDDNKLLEELLEDDPNLLQVDPLVMASPERSSFQRGSPSRDMYTPDFESDVDDTSSTGTSCSSTSGSFECLNGKSESTEVEAQSKTSACEDEKGVENVNVNDDDDEEEEESIMFTPHSWDSNAQPNRSSLMSPERKEPKMKKSVSFHEEDPPKIYNYPKEYDSEEEYGISYYDFEDEEEEEDGRNHIEYSWSLNYSDLNDWDFQPAYDDDDEIPEDIIVIEDPDSDESPAPLQSQSIRDCNIYSITGNFYDEDLDSLDSNINLTNLHEISTGNVISDTEASSFGENEWKEVQLKEPETEQEHSEKDVSSDLIDSPARDHGNSSLDLFDEKSQNSLNTTERETSLPKISMMNDNNYNSDPAVQDFSDFKLDLTFNDGWSTPVISTKISDEALEREISGFPSSPEISRNSLLDSLLDMDSFAPTNGIAMPAFEDSKANERTESKDIISPDLFLDRMSISSLGNSEGFNFIADLESEDDISSLSGNISSPCESEVPLPLDSNRSGNASFPLSPCTTIPRIVVDHVEGELGNGNETREVFSGDEADILDSEQDNLFSDSDTELDRPEGKGKDDLPLDRDKSNLLTYVHDKNDLLQDLNSLNVEESLLDSNKNAEIKKNGLSLDFDILLPSLVDNSNGKKQLIDWSDITNESSRTDGYDDTMLTQLSSEAKVPVNMKIEHQGFNRHPSKYLIRDETNTESMLHKDAANNFGTVPDHNANGPENLNTNDST